LKNGRSAGGGSRAKQNIGVDALHAFVAEVEDFELTRRRISAVPEISSAKDRLPVLVKPALWSARYHCRHVLRKNQKMMILRKKYPTGRSSPSDAIGLSTAPHQA
jgi:hypothetical protein